MVPCRNNMVWRRTPRNLEPAIDSKWAMRKRLSKSSALSQRWHRYVQPKGTKNALGRKEPGLHIPRWVHHLQTGDTSETRKILYLDSSTNRAWPWPDLLALNTMARPSATALRAALRTPFVALATSSCLVRPPCRRSIPRLYSKLESVTHCQTDAYHYLTDSRDDVRTFHMLQALVSTMSWPSNTNKPVRTCTSNFIEQSPKPKIIYLDRADWMLKNKPRYKQRADSSIGPASRGTGHRHVSARGPWYDLPSSVWLPCHHKARPVQQTPSTNEQRRMTSWENISVPLV